MTADVAPLNGNKTGEEQVTATEHDTKSTEIAGTLMELLTGFRASRAICVAVKLGIPDVLTARPMSSAELAMATNAHPLSVRRLMRALSALGIFEEPEPDRFRLTPTGSLLRSDVPGSLRPVALFLAGEKGWLSWGNLLYSVRTGKTAFEHVFGMQVFDYYLSQPEESAIHDQAMAALSSAVAASVVAAYNFAGFRVVVDVGGGTGLLLAEIVAAHRHLRGVLFDLPNVVAGAPALLEAHGIADRCRIEAGSFFESVPEEGDAYLMKSILHDWDDERATAILAACRKAMAPTAKLLVIDRVMPGRAEQGQSTQGYFADLEMLVSAPGGRERTGDEFRNLLAGAGFELQRVIPTGSHLSVVEARPRQ